MEFQVKRSFVFMDMWTCRRYTKYIVIADLVWALILTLVNLIILFQYGCFIEENLLDGWLNEDVTLLLLIIISSLILLLQLIFAIRLLNSSRNFDSSPRYCRSASLTWVIGSYVFVGLQVVKILTLLVLWIGSGNVENRNSLRKWVFILLSLLDIAFRAVCLNTIRLFYEKHVAMIEKMKARPNSAVFRALSEPFDAEAESDPSPY